VVVTSYLQNDYSRQIFIKRRQAIIKQLSSFILAVVLIVFDARFHQNPIRQLVGNIGSSFQILVTRPITWISSLHEFVFSQQQMQQSNAYLEQKVLNLEYQLSQKKLQFYQFDKLKQWLDKQDAGLQFATSANLLQIQVNPNRQVYVIDQGRESGVFQGQIAIDGNGVIGQVIDVGKYTSTILLVSDARSAVPIINQRTGEHGIVTGGNDQYTLQLMNATRTGEVEPGDVLMTSGLGKVYPFGIPVGRVTSVTTNPGEDFLQVQVKPAAKLNNHHMVILLKSFDDISKWQQELAERLKNAEVNQ
jgi:rod shape-determining protein MreC